MIERELERLLADAKQDLTLKNALLRTRSEADPTEAFCACCRSNGYQITPGERFAVGLSAGDAQLRSVNGGGVTPIDGWDDAYEHFFASLIWSS